MNPRKIEFTITRRGDKQVLHRRIVTSNEDIRYLHFIEWLHYKWEVAHDDELWIKDYKIQGRRVE